MVLILIIFQVQDYERNQEILSGVDGAQSDKSYPFDFCWENMSQKTVTPTKPIPGHAKPRSSGKSSRSPRNSLPKSPSSSSLSKSPKSPKSPSSSSLAGLTNEELQKLKESVASDIGPKKEPTVKFADDDFPPL